MAFAIPPGRFARAALVAAIVGFCVHVAHTTFGLRGNVLTADVASALLVFLSAAGTAICLAGALNTERDRGAWIAMSVGLGSWTAGELAFLLYPASDAPTPSLADLFYVGFYPAVAVALVLLVKPHVRDFRLWLDGLVTGLMLMGIAAAVTPFPETVDGGWLGVAATVAYPAGDLLLLGFVTAVLTVTGFRPGPRWALLGTGFVLTAIADTIFSHEIAVGTYTANTALDSLWPAALLLIAVAAWAKPPSRRRTPGTGRAAFVLAAVFTFTGLSIMVFDHYAPLPDLAVWLVVPALTIRIARTLLTFEDMGRALRAAQVAAALVEASGDAVVRVDRDGIVKTWNPGAAAIFGHDAAAVVGSPLTDLIAPRSEGTFPELLATAADGVTVGVSVSALRADGEGVELALTLSPIRDGRGRVRGLTVIAHDMTERRRIEIAERDSRAKSAFLSRMSHELRTPLNAVLGWAQLLAMRDHEPEAREEIRHILKAGDHLLEVINETLEISHIESGRLALTTEPVEVAPLVDEVVGLLSPLAAAREVTVAVDSESLASWVAADRQRLKQVLINLISNAIKFNSYAGRVDVRGEHGDGDGDRLAIAVKDTGIGIAAADMPRVFSPFERLRTREEDPEGSGLGLALSKGLMEAMEGSIDADSELGAGSTFTIELPRAQAPAPEPPAADADAAAPAAPGRAGEINTMLYIEDNAANRTLMEQIFATCDDLELTTAEDGTLGLAAAREQRPDLILLDLNLPDIDGDEVLARLYADDATRCIPVIVVSADATRAQIDALLERGAFDYLTKPIDIEQLMSAIDAALASLRL
jgi:PAS domain S-box-containing protein